MGLRKLIEDIRALWWYVCDGQFGALGDGTPMEEKSEPNFVKDLQDKVSPNLYIGKIIQDSILKCEVVDIHDTNIHVKILEIYWDRMGTYLDVGKIYPVFKHRGWGKGLEVWEISSKRMKRSTSQVIFQWEEGIGWCWDLDM